MIIAADDARGVGQGVLTAQVGVLQCVLSRACICIILIDY